MALIANIGTLADSLISSMESKGAFNNDVGEVDEPYKASVRTEIIDSWTIILNFLIANTSVSTTLDTSLNSVFSSGVPVPNDGGTALQTAWKASTVGGSADSSSGGIS